MKSRYLHRNLNFFSYDPRETASTATSKGSKTFADRTLSDWNRQVTGGTEGCIYYINGQQLCELRKQETIVDGHKKVIYKAFESIEELQQFFKDNLFNKLAESSARNIVSSAESEHRQSGKRRKKIVGQEAIAKLQQRESQEKRSPADDDETMSPVDLAVQQACYQWHQAGIQHATYQYASRLSLEKFPKIGLTEPDSIIHFRGCDEGVLITEENTLRKWQEKDMSGRKPVTHQRKKDEEYYAYTKTEYLFTPTMIEIKDIEIDCPSSALAPMFDARPQAEQGKREGRFIRALYSYVEKLTSSTAKLAAQNERIAEVETKETTQTRFRLPR